MSKANSLYIITKNVMEGAGFKSFFEQNKPEYEIHLQLLSGSSAQIDLFNELKTTIKNNSTVIIDTDSFEDVSLFDFLLDLNERGIKCIIYSNLSTPGLIIKARELLISGYVSKKSPVNCLLDCLNVIELGGTYYDTSFSDLLKEILLFENNLSLTERKIFHEVLLFNNRPVKDLANIMNVSKHTVEVHLSNLYKKAHVNGYTELVSCFSL